MLEKNLKFYEEEEQELIFTEWNVDLAYEIGKDIVEFAKKERKTVGVEIYTQGRTVFKYLSQEATPNHEKWLSRKRNSVLFFYHSTAYLYKKMEADETQLVRKYGLPCEEATIIPGGFPIYVKGVGIIGSLCVTGMSFQEDHHLIVEMIKKWKEKKVNLW